MAIVHATGLQLLLASAVLGLLAPSPVYADVGVQPVQPGGSSIQPEEQTPIEYNTGILVWRLLMGIYVLIHGAWHGSWCRDTMDTSHSPFFSAPEALAVHLTSR